MYVLDINECTEGTAQCPSHSTCGNTIGSFVCNCDSGFRKVADMCEGNSSSWSLFKSYCMYIDITIHADIDECAARIASCPDVNSHCTNTPGSYQCDCNIGFMNNETACIG